MEKYKNISYFEGLDTLRFFAAFLVLMHHAEVIRQKNNLFNLEWLGLFRNGGNAVSFFFVLSGFLITYLLLKENYKTKTISIKKFYLKRVLRIWPLYYLLVIIGTIIVPLCFNMFHIDYEMPYTLGDTWYYFVFFVPGLVTFFYGHHLLEPLWSIGVEEVFYLIWAPLFKFLKRYILYILLGIIALKYALIIINYYCINNNLVGYLINTFSFEAMAIGGLGAYFVFNSKKDISNIVIYNKVIQVIVYSLLAVFLLFHANINNPVWMAIFKTPVISSILINFLFLYTIIGVSLVKQSILKPRNKILSFFGEISYGIYMYHMLVIFTIILFCKGFLAQLNPVLATVIFYCLATAGTILVSYLSKRFFEDPFLRIKERIAS